VNDWKNLYTYDENNNQTEMLNQNWDGSAWVNDWKNLYTFDENNNLSRSINQDWENSAWVDDWNNYYTYDENNNITERLSQNWNDSVWVNEWKNLYTYDGNNNPMNFLHQTWNGSAWINDYNYNYLYSIVTAVDDDLNPINDYVLSNNYPNPFNPSTTINYSIPKESLVSIVVYNALGEEVAELVNEIKQAGSYQIVFNASSLPSGVYFYNFQVKDFIETKKMILLK